MIGCEVIASFHLDEYCHLLNTPYYKQELKTICMGTLVYKNFNMSWSSIVLNHLAIIFSSVSSYLRIGQLADMAHAIHPAYFYMKGGTLRYPVKQNTYHQPYTMHVVDGKNTHTHLLVFQPCTISCPLRSIPEGGVPLPHLASAETALVRGE